MKLTKKQETSCRLFSELDDVIEAYTGDYSCNGKRATIYKNARRLLVNPKIKQRLRELKEQALDSLQPDAHKCTKRGNLVPTSKVTLRPEFRAPRTSHPQNLQTNKRA